MPRDYKNAGQARRKQGGPEIGPWPWAIGGFVLGFAAAMGVTWLHQSETEIPEFRLEPPKTNRQAKASEEGETEEREGRGRFDFYRMLKSFEVVVPEEEVEVRAGREGRDLEQEGRYILQVGSFRRDEDADRMRANLAMIGMESHIQKVTIEGGGTYHRVRIGPIEDPRELNRMRNRLQAEGIEPLVVRVREE
jgi:cell division protein FtsN